MVGCGDAGIGLVCSVWHLHSEPGPIAIELPPSEPVNVRGGACAAWFVHPHQLQQRQEEEKDVNRHEAVEQTVGMSCRDNHVSC